MPKHQSWWALSEQQVLQQLDSRSNGLSCEEQRRRLDLYGENKLPQTVAQSFLSRMISQFNNALIYVLLISAVVTTSLQHWLDTSVILGVVIINAIVGVIQEGKAEKALNAIRKILSLQAQVMRDGHVESVSAESLVPGDYVLVQSGDKIPADIRLLTSQELRVDESLLTGESQVVTKSPECVSQQTLLAERHCMLYSGTLVTAGHGAGVVTNTGLNTELGRISGLIESVETLSTPLLRQVSLFATRLSIVTVLIAILTFLLGWLMRGYSISDMFIASVGLAVAAIPEGLPAILTITLAIGVQRMAKRNAIIRQLPAVETLGAVSVICTDKTGTLTRNEMTVTDVILEDEHYSVSGVGYSPVGNIGSGLRLETQHPENLELLIRAALLCNDAKLVEEDDSWFIQGDPTEGALLSLARKFGFEENKEQGLFVRTTEIPFNSRLRYMATLHCDPQGQAVVFVKGAPEDILLLCGGSKEKGQSDQRQDYWHQQARSLAEEGKRVLALGYFNPQDNQFKLTPESLDAHLSFLGLVGIIDPPRAEAISAVKKAQNAGVEVKMITGDHIATAETIAQQMAIAKSINSITGKELEQMSDTDLEKAVRHYSVFARTTPEHKLRLISALQAQGLTVAMTGDGVNDAAALKRADVGIAMGNKGTEVAKQAAEIVLTDDNFASIVDAVHEGRVVYDNLKKGILFVLPTSGGEALSILFAIAFGLVLPITPVQILWINMVTAITLAMTLGFEPSENNVMNRKPRRPDEPLLSRFLIWRTIFVSLLMVAVCFGLYFKHILDGSSLELARTIAVNALVFCEIFYLFNTRVLESSVISLKNLNTNPIVWFAVIVLIFLQVIFTYTAPFQALFDTISLSWQHWVEILMATFLFFLIIEVEKWQLKRFEKV